MEVGKLDGVDRESTQGNWESQLKKRQAWENFGKELDKQMGEDGGVL